MGKGERGNGQWVRDKWKSEKGMEERRKVYIGTLCANLRTLVIEGEKRKNKEKWSKRIGRQK